ncbi:MAG: hypothetical protein K0R75_865 [Paenibacillaceae bacterium]|jgi:AraC-like DNA-binding protein|nr:hypothetical protein [Paenibacillaceae bacterium]
MINVLTINYEPPVPGWGYGHHNHSGYEFHYIPQGKGTLEVDGRVYEIRPGTIYLTGPGIYHKQKADLYDPMSEYCIYLELKVYHKNTRKRFPYRKEEAGELAEQLTSTPFWFGQDNSGAIPLFADLLRELSFHYFGRFTAVQCLIHLLFVKTVRNFVGNIENDHILPQKMFDDRRRTIVDDYFNNNGNHTRSPKDLAQKVGVSIRQLNRIVLEYYSMTFKQKLTSFRVEQAKDLLTHTELPVKEISQKVGYLSESYFCKVFKEIVRQTPSEYRTLGYQGTGRESIGSTVQASRSHNRSSNVQDHFPGQTARS